MVTVCFENEDVTTDGHTAAQAARELADAGADVVGINCLRPEHTLPLMKEMRRRCNELHRLPARGISHPQRSTAISRASAHFPINSGRINSRDEMGDSKKAHEMGINYIGSCCGAVATHVREMARALGKIPGRRCECGRRAGRKRCQPTNITITTANKKPENRSAARMARSSHIGRRSPNSVFCPQLFIRRACPPDCSSRPRPSPAACIFRSPRSAVVLMHGHGVVQEGRRSSTPRPPHLAARRAADRPSSHQSAAVRTRPSHSRAIAARPSARWESNLPADPAA